MKPEVSKAGLESPIEQVCALARGLLRSNKEAILAIFGYFDASKMLGSSWRDTEREQQISKTLCCAGFIAHESRWKAFDGAWAQMLLDFDVSELHMKNYAHFKDDFKGWQDDPDRRARFLARATEIIDTNLEASVVSGVSIEDYAYFNRFYQLEEGFGTPYAFVASTVLGAVARWHSESGSRDPLLCYFEHGDEGQGDLTRIRDEDGYPPFRFLRKQAPPNPPLNPIGPKDPWLKVMPFQAADFLAYESAKFANHFGQLATREQDRERDFESFSYWKFNPDELRKSHLGLLRGARPHMRWWAHGYLVSLIARRTSPRS